MEGWLLGKILGLEVTGEFTSPSVCAFGGLCLRSVYRGVTWKTRLFTEHKRFDDSELSFQTTELYRLKSFIGPYLLVVNGCEPHGGGHLKRPKHQAPLSPTVSDDNAPSFEKSHILPHNAMPAFSDNVYKCRLGYSYNLSNATSPVIVYRNCPLSSFSSLSLVIIAQQHMPDMVSFSSRFFGSHQASSSHRVRHCRGCRRHFSSLSGECILYANRNAWAR